jgi:hypothetical protein
MIFERWLTMTQQVQGAIVSTKEISAQLTGGPARPFSAICSGRAFSAVAT